MGIVDANPGKGLVIGVMGGLRVSTPQFWSIRCACPYQKTPLTALRLIGLVRRLAELALRRGNTSAIEIVVGKSTGKGKVEYAHY